VLAGGEVVEAEQAAASRRIKGILKAR